MRQPIREEVIDAIIKGINKSQADYEVAYYSDISSPYAPEYLITVYIFQSILELKVKYDWPYTLSLEEPVRSLVKSLGAHGRPQNRLRVRGKCDLSLRDDNDRARAVAVIEVKKDARKYEKDLGRITCLVEQGLGFGVIASCRFAKVEDDNFKETEGVLKKEIEDIYREVRKAIRTEGTNLYVERVLGTITDWPSEGKPPDPGGKWKWCPVCFVICDKKKH